MNSIIPLKTTTPSLLVTLAFLCFMLLPQIQAAPQVAPAPDGCYPAFTTAEGCNALFGLGAGQGNTALGWYSLFSVDGGNFNTGVGAGTLVLNTADSNTAVGAAALLLNTTGTKNTAIGTDALVHNDTAEQNTATGAFALFSHVTGNANTATGNQALFSDTSGQLNTADGAGALFTNTTGGFNTAIGGGALSSNTTGGDNTAVGADALGNTTTGSENIAFGQGAGANLTTGNNNIDIGNSVTGNPGEANTIRIGQQGTQTATFIGGISGATVPGGVSVIIDANGHLGTIVSSQRFKEEIKPMDDASEAILALRPVTFRYKKELDPERLPQFGLVAEQVEKVNPDLVARDAKGDVYTVRYEAVNAMLLNEFLKEHSKIEQQEATIAELKSTLAQQQKSFQSKLAEQEKRIQAVALDLQRVTTEMQTKNSAEQVIASTR